MTVLSEGEPPPFGPGAGLGLAVLCLGGAFVLVRFIQRAYKRDPRTSNRATTGPRWWRIRVIGHRQMTAVPIVFFCICAGLSMIGYSLSLWTGLNGVGIASALSGLAAVGCFLWGVYDSFGPRAWRRNGRDEYTLW